MPSILGHGVSRVTSGPKLENSRWLEGATVDHISDLCSMFNPAIFANSRYAYVKPFLPSGRSINAKDFSRLARMTIQQTERGWRQSTYYS
jgi:hypothetical protein